MTTIPAGIALILSCMASAFVICLGVAFAARQAWKKWRRQPE